MIAKALVLVAGAATAANAYTLTTQLAGTNPVLTPNNNGAAEPVIGQDYSVTWDGAGLGDVVDLALCQGPSTACNVVGNIALGIPNNNKYTWTVDCALQATTTNAGYGILLIDDATGRYQYSTQFGLLPDSAGVCGSTSASGSASAPSGSPTGGKSMSKGGSTLTTSSSSAPSSTGSGSQPTGGYALNSTSTTYVMPTAPAGGPNPSATPVSSSRASALAFNLAGVAVALFAAAAFLA